METQPKANSQWVGLTVYLLAQLVLPGLKLAGKVDYSWWAATCLLWGPVLVLAVMIFLGMLIKAAQGRPRA